MRFVALLFCAVLTFGTASTAVADAAPRVTIDTTAGSFQVELLPDRAPVTVENFLAYVADGFYDGLVFHRVIENFMIQTGGYTADLRLREPGADIVNESVGGPQNLRGTLAMARLRNPDSANSQFFVNVRDNAHLDARGERAGYTVFGRVIAGMDVVDAISRVPTGVREGMADVPAEPVVIERARLDHTP